MIGQSDETGTASVDLAVGFFCAVLVLFVFVVFNRDDDPRPDVPVTLAQTELTREIYPGTWSAVNARTSFAVFASETLTILDLPALVAGLADPLQGYSADDGFALFSPLAEDAPYAFALRLSLTVSPVPEAWSREVVVAFTSDAPCPMSLQPIVTVLTPKDTPDLSPMIAFLRQCGHRARIEVLDNVSDAGLASLQIGLSAGHYNADRMFR
jgi:hypothetical protein